MSWYPSELGSKAKGGIDRLQFDGRFTRMMRNNQKFLGYSLLSLKNDARKGLENVV
jgi:hypothetical protein